jgi:Zn-dependent peptidase ImmA (M78 family)
VADEHTSTLEIQFFISNQQKSASEQIDTLYRKFGDNFSKEDRWTIQEFIFLCESEQYVLDSLSFDRVALDFKPHGDFYKGHGQQGANWLRHKLNFQANRTIGDLYAELRKLRLHVFRRRLSNSNISGLFIKHPTAGRCILVNYDEDIFRQNFTVAHETAHAIFDFDDNVNVSMSTDKNKDYREIRANTFASNFLIPKQALEPLKGSSLSELMIMKLALALHVNVEPLLIALKEAKVFDESEIQGYRSLKVKRNQKVDPELDGLEEKIVSAKRTLLENGLSSFYVRKCHEAYVNRKISANKLAEMMLTSESDLPTLLGLFNLSLLYDN